MTIRIFAGGCRSTTETGRVEDRYCNECPQQTTCDLAPCARELARILANRWVKVRDGLPLKTSVVLYLKSSDGELSGTTHYGHYNWHQKTFNEQDSGKATPHDLVIAWLLIPEVSADIHEELRRKLAHACLD